MDLGDDAQIDGECELHGGAFFQTEIFGFDEHSVGAQVTCSAEFAGSARDRNVDYGSSSMSCVEASLHIHQSPVT